MRSEGKRNWAVKELQKEWNWLLNEKKRSKWNASAWFCTDKEGIFLFSKKLTLWLKLPRHTWTILGHTLSLTFVFPSADVIDNYAGKADLISSNTHCVLLGGFAELVSSNCIGSNVLYRFWEDLVPFNFPAPLSPLIDMDFEECLNTTTSTAATANGMCHQFERLVHGNAVFQIDASLYPRGTQSY